MSVREEILLIGSSGLVGRALEEGLREGYRIVPAAGHQVPDGGYCLTAEEPDWLREVLGWEEPDIVISTIRGDFGAQMRFHETLADWCAQKDKRLLYVSTSNVFDGDLSRPHTEADPPTPESEYGVFKRDCEEMLYRRLGERLIIFRLAFVWTAGCPRIRALKAHSQTRERHRTVRNDAVNVTLARQVGDYARYVLDHDLRGVFHVGTTDTVDYFAFEKLVCEALNIAPPAFDVTEAEPQAYQAVLPKRKEIPAELQLTVAQVLDELRREENNFEKTLL